jgi:putative transposase
MSRVEPQERVTVRGLCEQAGFSRQAYYREMRVRERQAVAEEAIVELVNLQRRIHPRIGARKLCVLIGPDLQTMGIAIGRDRLLALLRRRGLLVKRSRRWTKTTDSRHGFTAWPNRIAHIVPSMPHQVLVCDLTYIATEEGFLYLSLVTDSYSRKIVGFCIHDTLESEGCLRALKMALAQLPEGAQPIHHSDRGIQYCCREYIALLQKWQCLISMTEQNHCYENAQAERINGILKDEYRLGQTFTNKQQAIATARQAIAIYNDLRPHTRLGYRTPSCVHAHDTKGLAA